MINRRSYAVALFIHLAAVTLLTPLAEADVRLPCLFGDHMALQRERPVPVWGWADPGEAVRITFAGQTKEAVADATGRWRADLDAMPASAEGRDLVVAGNTTITLTNVVVGEVWICSGQSNMEWALNSSRGGADARDAANLPLIRLIDLPHEAPAVPADKANASWKLCAPATVGGFSAVGFYFGRKLLEDLQVPIGLIGANWGGTKIEPWTPPAGFEAVPELAEMARLIATWDPSREEGQIAYKAALEATRVWLPAAEEAVQKGAYPPPQPTLPGPAFGHQEPTRIYNGMIHPLKPYSVRGAIWYQGESNGGEGESYFWKTQALVKGWREVFENPDLSFYFVQLANFQADSKTPAGGTGYARLREAQRKSLTIPNTGMAVIIDIGEGGNIHPGNKLDVGLRLAYWALNRNYGRDLVYSGPLYKSHEVVEGSAIRIHFDHVGSGLMAGVKSGLEPTVAMPEAKLARFAVAGEDKVWQWADAIIEPEGRTVRVSSPNVPAPVAVRYAFDANPTGCNLYNKEGLPASPFRTDDW